MNNWSSLVRGVCNSMNALKKIFNLITFNICDVDVATNFQR